MFGGAVVAGHADGFLFPIRGFRQDIGKHLDVERLHHAASVTEHVPTETVNQTVAAIPCHGAVNGVLTDAVAAVINQGFPFHIAAGGNVFVFFAERAFGIDIRYFDFSHRFTPSYPTTGLARRGFVCPPTPGKLPARCAPR